MVRTVLKTEREVGKSASRLPSQVGSRGSPLPFGAKGKSGSLLADFPLGKEVPISNDMGCGCPQAAPTPTTHIDRDGPKPRAGGFPTAEKEPRLRSWQNRSTDTRRASHETWPDVPHQDTRPTARWRLRHLTIIRRLPVVAPSRWWPWTRRVCVLAAPTRARAVSGARLRRGLFRRWRPCGRRATSAPFNGSSSARGARVDPQAWEDSEPDQLQAILDAMAKPATAK